MTEAPVLWSLRPITKAEFEWGYALHRETLREYVEPTWGWDEVVQQRLFADSFDLDDRKVIEVDGEPVGVLQVDERPDELFLVLIELRPDWQNRGLGTAILRSLLGRAEGLQRPLTLHVLRTNRRAAALYERLGMRVIRSDPVRLVLGSGRRRHA